LGVEIWVRGSQPGQEVLRGTRSQALGKEANARGEVVLPRVGDQRGNPGFECRGAWSQVSAERAADHRHRIGVDAVLREQPLERRGEGHLEIRPEGAAVLEQHAALAWALEHEEVVSAR